MRIIYYPLLLNIFFIACNLTVLFGYATTVLGYIWLVAISLIFLLIATYKYIQVRLEPKDAPRESGEIINNDQSKLFDGCMSSNITNEIIVPTSDEEICNNVFGPNDGWGYDNNIRKRYNYSGDSHFANEVCNIKKPQALKLIKIFTFKILF